MAMNERIYWHFLWGCWLEALIKQEVTEKTHDNRMKNEKRARESGTVNVAKVKKKIKKREREYQADMHAMTSLNKVSCTDVMI